MWIKIDKNKGAFLIRSEENMEIKNFTPFAFNKWFHISDVNGKIYINGEEFKKKESWMNSKAYCWFCKKDIDCECMDATCWVCGRPYLKNRCKEFGFDESGNKL